MTLGEKIYQLRKNNGISQTELANQLGVSRQAVSKWELDESAPEIEKLVALAKLFSVSTDFLLGCDEPQEQYREKEPTAAETAPVSVTIEKTPLTKSTPAKSVTCLVLGALIIGILAVLSNIFGVKTEVPVIQAETSALSVLGEPVTKFQADAPATMYIDGAGFFPFLREFRLIWLFVLGCALTLYGAVSGIMQITARRKARILGGK